MGLLRRVCKDPKFLHVDSEDSYQTWRLPRLIRVFAGHTCNFAGFVIMRLNIKFFLNFFPIPVHNDGNINRNEFNFCGIIYL